MGAFVKKLQQMGVYDDAAVFIMGDHGLLWGSDAVHYGAYAPAQTEKTNSLDPFAKKPRALPMVLFKPPKATGKLQISDKPVSLLDIAPTVLDVAGIEPDIQYEGVSLLQLDDGPRVRKFFSSEYKKRSSGPLYEYAVSGFSWHDQSWIYTGNVLYKGKKERAPFDNYVEGETLSFGASGTGMQYLDANWSPDADGHWATTSKAGISLPVLALSENPRARITLSPLQKEGETQSRRVRVYVNGVKGGIYKIVGRQEIAIAIPRGRIVFKEEKRKPAASKPPWLALPPEPSETRINILFSFLDLKDAETGDESQFVAKIHALTIENTPSPTP